MNPGDVIGPYRVLATLGEGGMGVVYRARDPRLNRDVALKILPGAVAGDADRLARFRREAQVLASLNHPNIAHLYGVEDTAPAASTPASHALVMELVDGPTLAARIASGPMPVNEALAIARQMAQAIEAAHDQGIIHRDLKPANIKVRDDGTVKVLDFGLAKAMLEDGGSRDRDAAAETAMNSPTLTAPGTALGMILGTAAYMAPEQAKGRAVDRRADIWAFGVVLFEMLTGRRAFDGDGVSEVLASVLKSDPDWSALPADVPHSVRRLLRRCLEKDPRRRLRDLAEGMLQLDEGLAAEAATSSAGATMGTEAREIRRASWWRRAWPLAVTAVITAVAVVGIGVWRAPIAAPRAPIRFQIEPPASAPFFSSGTSTDLAISGDGQALFYLASESGQPHIWVRRLDQLEATAVRGGDVAVTPIPSPTGDWVAFVDQTQRGQLDKVSIAGGPRVPVARVKTAIYGGTWTHDDKIVLGGLGSPLMIVGAGGGDPTPLTTLGPGESDHLWPSEVPGTSVVLFTIHSGGLDPSADSQLAAIDRASGRTVRLGIAGFFPRFVPPGRLMYATRDGVIRAVAFDPGTLAVTGSPVVVLEGVSVKGSAAADFDVSADGRLVYVSGAGQNSARLLTWTDRTGHETPIAAPPKSYFYARVSPDGTRLSLDVRAEQENVWIWDLARENLTRLTDRPGMFEYCLWADAQHLVFSSLGSKSSALMTTRADGSSPLTPVGNFGASDLTPYPNAVTPDGRAIVFRASPADAAKNDLYVVSMTGAEAPKKLLATEHDELNAALSPDGKWMTYQSDLSGQFEVYVRPFPNVEDGQWKLSTDGGYKPLWSPAGREIFYLSGGNMMAVPVETARGFVPGKPRVLFGAAAYFLGAVGRNFDVTPDGTRFIMIKNPSAAGSRSLPISVVLNWADEVGSRVK